VCTDSLLQSEHGQSVNRTLSIASAPSIQELYADAPAAPGRTFVPRILSTEQKLLCAHQERQNRISSGFDQFTLLREWQDPACGSHNSQAQSFPICLRRDVDASWMPSPLISAERGTSMHTCQVRRPAELQNKPTRVRRTSFAVDGLCCM
jgi:hypothetical protein